MPREYRFLTTWLLECERERVWDAIFDSEAWPSWWRGVERVVELESGDADGVGQLARYTWRSALPYELTFDTRTVRADRPYLLEGQATGQLEGTGIWRLFEQTDPGGPEGSVTAVVYEWNVSTTKWWMNLLAPIARPAFAWNHDWVMGNGGEGIAKLLGCRLRASD